jgi:hypothetical protein
MRGLKILIHADNKEEILWALRHLVKIVEGDHPSCNAVLMDKTIIMRPLREDENIRYLNAEHLP